MIILGAGLSFQTFSFLGQLVFFPNFAFLPLSYPIDMVMVKGQEFQCRMGGGGVLEYQIKVILEWNQTMQQRNYITGRLRWSSSEKKDRQTSAEVPSSASRKRQEGLFCCWLMIHFRSYRPYLQNPSSFFLTQNVCFGCSYEEWLSERWMDCSLLF